MKNLILFLSLVLLASCTTPSPYPSELVPNGERFANRENVHTVKHKGKTVGQFWPVKKLGFITKQTDPDLFEKQKGLATILEETGAVAIVPGAMTAINGLMEGTSLSRGRPCGNDSIYNYGIITTDTDSSTRFSHKKELNGEKAFATLFKATKEKQGNLLFLPSIYRVVDGRSQQNASDTTFLDKCLVLRGTPDGDQIGVVVFSGLITNRQAIEILTGLDRPGQSKTLRIYVLDGGPIYGQWAKVAVNSLPITIGKRDPQRVTNYVLLY